MMCGRQGDKFMCTTTSARSWKCNGLSGWVRKAIRWCKQGAGGWNIDGVRVTKNEWIFEFFKWEKAETAGCAALMTQLMVEQNKQTKNWDQHYNSFKAGEISKSCIHEELREDRSSFFVVCFVFVFKTGNCNKKASATHCTSNKL